MKKEKQRKTVKYAGDVKEGPMACMTQGRVEMRIVPGLKSGGVVCIYTRQDVGRESNDQRDCEVMRDVGKGLKA
jgi:hypothetical protein